MMPRPKLPADQRRDQRIQFDCSADERSRWKDAAGCAGLSLAAFMREALDTAAEKVEDADDVFSRTRSRPA